MISRKPKQAGGALVGKDHRRGATIVEFTLSFMVFLLVLLGLMELGRAVWTYSTISHVTRQAGRYYMVHGSMYTADASELKQVVTRDAIGLDASKLTIKTRWKREKFNELDTIITEAVDVERGDTAEIEVSYPFQLITGDLIVDSSNFKMSSKTQVVVMN